MRTMLLIPATLLALAGVPALAQTATPDTSAPDAGTATDTPSAIGQTGATAPKTMHNHHIVHHGAADPDGQTFAHEPGTGESGPASMKASNTSEADSPSAIAPHFPQPRGGMNAGPRGYLRDADRALAMHHTGEAQQALEMAETRLLDRSTPIDAAGHPSEDPMVQLVARARRALGAGDAAGARAAIGRAMASGPTGEDSGGL